MNRNRSHGAPPNEPTSEPGRRLILNPESGEGNHAPRVRRLAVERGYTVYATERSGDAAAFARDAVRDGTHELAVCGGDGTLKEVLSGLADAGALVSHLADARSAMDAARGTRGDEHASGPDAGADVDSGTESEADTASDTTPATPTIGVIPAGTANIVARDMGITDIETGFEVLETGETRRLDVGMAGGEPFLKSCIAGLTADTSAAVTDESKARFGSLAFVVEGIEQARRFDPLRVEIDAHAAGHEWSFEGEALCVLVGNARRYAGRTGPANAEDGLFDVTIVEEMPPENLVAEAVARQLLDQETEHVTRITARRLEIASIAGRSIRFSLDGEIYSHDRLDLRTRPGALPFRVGPAYELGSVDP